MLGGVLSPCVCILCLHDVSVCLCVFAHERAWLVWARSCLSLFVAVPVSMGVFGGVGGGLVSLGLVCCVFMMSLAVSVRLKMGAFGGVGIALSLCVWGYVRLMVGKADSPSQFCRVFCFLPLPHTGFERKGGLRFALPSSDTAREKKQCFFCMLFDLIDLLALVGV